MSLNFGALNASALSRLANCRNDTRLTNIELPMVVELRLGVPITAAGVCRCGAVLDMLADHSCNRGVETNQTPVCETHSARLAVQQLSNR